MINRKIKVLHIITHLDLGGAQRTTLELLKRLNRKIFEIYFISSSGSLIKELDEINGIKVYLISNLKRKINLIDDLIAFLKLFNYLRKKKFDVVHTHSPKAGFLGRWAAKLARVPIIIHTFHGFPFYKGQNPVLKNLYIFLERITAKITDSLIVICESDLNKGISARIGFREKYHLIREGIEIKKVNFSNLLYNHLNISYSFPLIGMVACLKPQKAPLDFVKVASLIKEEYPNAKFILVGGGPLYKKVKNLVKKMNLENNFFLLGWQENAQELISLFDIFVLTSIWEGLPLVILEAISLGKPVVATNVDGIREVIKDGENGFLVKPADYYTLAQKIILLIKNEDLRKKISMNNLSVNLTSVFNFELMAEKTENLYLNLMEVKYGC